MNVIWFGLAIYAVVEAIAAARRVGQRQRVKAASQAGPGLDEPSLQALPASPDPVAALPAAQAEPDQADAQLNLNQPKMASNRRAANLLVEPEPLAAQLTTNLDLPLAVSVSVTELAQSAPPSVSTLDLNLVPPELAVPELASAKADRQSGQAEPHQSVLAEIAELDRTDAVSHFQRYLDHPDDVVRAATVFELGELAAQRSGPEASEILDLLTPLSQDPDPQVRSQVVVALAKLQAAIAPQVGSLGEGNSI
jgi:HEAT repeat protein